VALSDPAIVQNHSAIVQEDDAPRLKTSEAQRYPGHMGYLRMIVLLAMTFLPWAGIIAYVAHAAAH
jgi:hypothetical protein